MTFDWKSSAKFENGHRRSHVNPPNRGLLPPLKINIPPISGNPNKILTRIAHPSSKVSITGQV